MNVGDNGLIVILGCTHAGIINIINYAKKITKVDEVYDVFGGFHLADKTKSEIDMVIDEINGLKPEMVVPLHCTGFDAVNKFSRRVNGFEVGVVGASFCL